MTDAQADFYRRVEAFQFDGDDTSLTFAQRLAKENGWSAEYARRAIHEYRRFAFLAAAAGHPVSPPEAIDQVWHLHLLYTRSYWQNFCPDVLGMTLHHEPSRGGAEERSKFDDWYAMTLASYERLFGEAPPADLWPDPLAKAVQARQEHFVWVDAAMHWILPITGVRRAAQWAVGAALLVAILFFASGCQADPGEQVNPFDFKGPQFLAFYGIAFAAACVLATLIRAGCRGGTVVRPLRQDLDPYAIAYLNGGARHAVNAAMASLYDAGAIDVRAGTARRTITRLDAAARDRLHPLECAVYDAAPAAQKTSLSSVRSGALNVCEGLGDQLKRGGLVVDDASASRAVSLGLVVTLLVPLIGIIKIGVGISRGRPVLFLVIACIVSVIVAIAVFSRRPHRTRRGDAALDYLRTQHSALRARSAQLQGDAVAAGVALFGLEVLQGTPLASLRAALKPPPGSHGSDGGGGCGTGSSCSGGGGGCGGCGG